MFAQNGHSGRADAATGVSDRCDGGSRGSDALCLANIDTYLLARRSWSNVKINWQFCNTQTGMRVCTTGTRARDQIGRSGFLARLPKEFLITLPLHQTLDRQHTSLALGIIVTYLNEGAAFPGCLADRMERL